MRRKGGRAYVGSGGACILLLRHDTHVSSSSYTGCIYVKCVGREEGRMLSLGFRV